MAASARLVIGFDVGYSATRRTSGFLLACLTGTKLTAIQRPCALTQATQSELSLARYKKTLSPRSRWMLRS